MNHKKTKAIHNHNKEEGGEGATLMEASSSQDLSSQTVVDDDWKIRRG